MQVSVMWDAKVSPVPHVTDLHISRLLEYRCSNISSLPIAVPLHHHFVPVCDSGIMHWDDIDISLAMI